MFIGMFVCWFIQISSNRSPSIQLEYIHKYIRLLFLFFSFILRNMYAIFSCCYLRIRLNFVSFVNGFLCSLLIPSISGYEVILVRWSSIAEHRLKVRSKTVAFWRLLYLAYLSILLLHFWYIHMYIHVQASV